MYHCIKSNFLGPVAKPINKSLEFSGMQSLFPSKGFAFVGDYVLCLEICWGLYAASLYNYSCTGKLLSSSKLSFKFWFKLILLWSTKLSSQVKLQEWIKQAWLLPMACGPGS